MTLNETVLEKLAEAKAPREGRQVLVVPGEGAGWSATLTTDNQDKLSCAVWELALQRSAAAPADATLQKWADRAAANVTGFVDTLHVYEVDQERNEALLRSVRPTMRGQTAFYFEVLLQGTTRSKVRRFQCAEANGKREQVAFVLTHEQVAKLAGDLAAE